MEHYTYQTCLAWSVALPSAMGTHIHRMEMIGYRPSRAVEDLWEELSQPFREVPSILERAVLC